MNRIKLSEAVVVEGRYDKIRLSALLDAYIVETRGFSVYRDKALQAHLRELAKTRGLVVLTDPDAAGFRIRGFIKSIAKDGRVLHAYIPDVQGKERRKDTVSAEGKLGVEGMDTKTLLDALNKAGITAAGDEAPRETVTPAHLFEDGFAGAGSNERRRRLIKRLGLPERTSAKALLGFINAGMTYDDYRRLADELD